MTAATQRPTPQRTAPVDAPTIVVLDGHTLNPGDNPWEEVAALGTLETYDRTSPSEVVERARHASIVLTNKTPITAELLAELPRLELVCVLATGHDVVDLDACKNRGVVVCNVPEYGSDSVAQHVFALLLALTNNVAIHDQAISRGEWNRAGDFSFWVRPVMELTDKTMGLVGLGSIGQRVARIARGFGMRVIACDPHPPEALPADVSLVELDRLFAEADVVSLHCPLDETNASLVDAARLRTMKPSALLINTARGGLVDPAALAAALRDGVIAGAGIDTVDIEPIHPNNPLLEAPGCYLTPHMAWTAREARQRLMRTTADNVRAFLHGQPINVV